MEAPRFCVFLPDYDYTFNMDPVDLYIAKQPENEQEILQALRILIKETSLEIQECLKWGYPSFGNKTDICYLAAQPNHINFDLSAREPPL